ncbi:MurR/RpiR family transcriptional regulator [Nocardioides sp. BP30]|uniref:MurR/RpiR family transcriptional regulator n=1 Tax=Nocardioides sp. BP30 TaxID=3036374 RepID=UPI002468337B|nr:MurR/RpiR family transcriptional regulator [Nocardioides sp. BP30]WGL52624.1 MurR/RpiR family transcriptional regulator [Nocardioides sp. BP30]
MSGRALGHRIDERITLHYDTLPPQERRAADMLLAQLDDLATYRAAELASLAGVSKATMSRLFRSLGFADFDEVRDHLRGLRTAGEPRRTDGAPSLSGHAESEGEAIRYVLESAPIPEAVRLLAGAERILVVGWRNSYPVALHLREQLAQIHPSVSVGPQPGQTIGEELAGIGGADVVVAVGFRRRPAGFSAFVGEALRTGAAVIVFADPTGSAYLARATVPLECPVQGELAFDSYAAAMSLVSALADGVLESRGREARERASAIASAYDRLTEVE